MLRKRARPEQLVNSPVFEREMLTLRVDEIKPHPQNVNVGDMDAIEESIEELGMFDPLIWNRRNGCLVTGHHTWLTLRRRGWTAFDVIVVDVDEETHVRMMLAHNAVAAKSRREEHGLARVLAELEAAGATRGTGYSDAEIRALVDRTTKDLERAKETATKLEADVDDVDYPDLDAPSTAGVTAPEDFADLPADLDGVYTLKPDVIFPGVGEWDIPELLPEMVPTYDEMPKNIMPWAGSATRNWPDSEQWWLYNIKVDSTSGMHDLSKAIPAFYVHDEYIEVWWQKLSQMVARMLHSGITYAVSPDFSPHNVGVEARFGSLYALFRNRYMARYMQQAGIKVIPNVNWHARDEKFMIEHILPTLPEGLPMIALQIQTAFSQARDKAVVEAQTEAFQRQVQLIFDALKPGGALIYYGKAGKEAFDAGVQVDCPIIWVPGRTNMLGDKGKRNMRKKTL